MKRKPTKKEAASFVERTLFGLHDEDHDEEEIAEDCLDVIVSSEKKGRYNLANAKRSKKKSGPAEQARREAKKAGGR